MPRPPNTSVRRQQIVLALLRLLAREGHGGVTMAALAKESGLAQGLLHYHFPDKAQMLAAALGELEVRLHERARRAAAGARDADQRLDAWLQALLGTQDVEREAVAAWVAVGSAAAVDRDLGALYVAALGRLRAALAPAFAGRPEGTLDGVLAYVEGAWRLGTLAPAQVSPGFALPVLRRMLDLSPSSEPRADRVLRALREFAPVDLSEASWVALGAAWSEPGRRHHDLEHLLDVGLAWLELAEEGRWQNAVAAFLALLFHDAVYWVGAPDNEEQSARLLLELAAGAAPAGTLAAAADLVRLTAGHGHHGAASLSPDARLLLDCDTAILGAPPARYARYVAGVRAEWAAVVDEAGWRAGRAAFLDRLLAQKRVFLSDRFRDRLEAQARENLAAERAALE
ncbi:TetR family transcriptional regulator [Myxococcota bacterium]|nr:TetR family transcriptional regulator [Myxococcota bacterium]